MSFPWTVSHIIYIYSRRGRTSLTTRKKIQKIHICAVHWITNTLTKEYQLSVVDGFDKDPFYFWRVHLYSTLAMRVYVDECPSSDSSRCCERFIILEIRMVYYYFEQFVLTKAVGIYSSLPYSKIHILKLDSAGQFERKLTL